MAALVSVVLQNLSNLRLVDWLGQNFVNAGLEGSLFVNLFAVASERDDEDLFDAFLLTKLSNIFSRGVAVFKRHIEVHENDVVVGAAHGSDLL